MPFHGMNWLQTYEESKSDQSGKRVKRAMVAGPPTLLKHRLFMNTGNRTSHQADASQLLITADCGGSNGIRIRLWKLELQRLSDEAGIVIHVCHFPPGTSKWNKIEHSMFCFITKNWRGRPLTSREVVVNLISNTINKKELEILAKLDDSKYETGIKVTDEQFESIAREKHDFHGK